MVLFKFIITVTLLVYWVSAVPIDDDELAFEIKLPSFVNKLLGIDESLRTFRATVGSLKENSNDISLTFSTNNASDLDKEIHKRASKDQNLMKFNIKGVDDAAAVFRSILKPINQVGSELLLKSIFSLLRRSTQEVKPNVELGPGAIKTEIITYPPNFLERRLKHLLKIKKKQEEEEKAEEDAKSGNMN